MIVHLKTPIMAVKIRLQRRGRKKRPFYHIVIADSRSPRDGRFIEKIGTYNPMTKPATIELDQDKAFDWLMKGAQPTDTARAILRFKGVLYRKHLARGVRKEALTQEQADAKLNEWMAVKEERIAKRVEESRQELEQQKKKTHKHTQQKRNRQKIRQWLKPLRKERPLKKKLQTLPKPLLLKKGRKKSRKKNSQLRWQPPAGFGMSEIERNFAMIRAQAWIIAI